MTAAIFSNYFIYSCFFIVSSVGFQSTSGQKKQEDYFPSEKDHRSNYLASPPQRPKREGKSYIKYSVLLSWYFCLLIVF